MTALFLYTFVMRFGILLIILFLTGCANELMYNVGTTTNPVWTNDVQEAVSFHTREICSDRMPEYFNSPEMREYFVKTISYDQCYDTYSTIFAEEYQIVAKEYDEPVDDEPKKAKDDEASFVLCAYIEGRYKAEKSKQKRKEQEARNYWARANSARDQNTKNNLNSRGNKALSSARLSKRKAEDKKRDFKRKGCKGFLF